MTKHYGLIGYPLEHSFSRQWFLQKFKSENINADYRNFEISSIKEVTQIIASYSLSGINITAPYKEHIIAYLTELSPEAAAIGAVNVVCIDDGKLIGYNTDYIGFCKSLRPSLLPTDKHALVLGSGGAAKAVCYALKQMNIDYKIVSRSTNKGDITYSDLSQSVIDNTDIIVNCTPLGMYPQVNALPPIPYEYITSKHLLYDLIYNPSPSKFLEKGLVNGARTSNGLQMLYEQAEAAFNLFVKH